MTQLSSAAWRPDRTHGRQAALSGRASGNDVIRRAPSSILASSIVASSLVAVAALFMMSVGCQAVFAADIQGSPADEVVATVNGAPIFATDVQRQVDRVLRGRKAEPAALVKMNQTAREQLISRQLILLYLKRHDVAPSTKDIDVEVGRISKRLALEEKTLEDYLSASKLSMEQLRSLLSWQLGWQWYLDRYLTDANLEKHFNEHQMEFDGSQQRVAQILFKADPADKASLKSALAKAKALRTEIVEGKIKFTVAAAKHSESPSGKMGGDIGWISRHEPMPESFSKAAFTLKPNDVSQPVISPFGVHLIQCLKTKPGQRRWTDVREALQVSVTAFLFQWVADQERPKAQIQRMDATRQ